VDLHRGHHGRRVAAVERQLAGRLRRQHRLGRRLARHRLAGVGALAEDVGQAAVPRDRQGRQRGGAQRLREIAGQVEALIAVVFQQDAQVRRLLKPLQDLMGLDLEQPCQ
jgi:hypothetical protein